MQPQRPGVAILQKYLSRDEYTKHNGYLQSMCLSTCCTVQEIISMDTKLERAQCQTWIECLMSKSEKVELLFEESLMRIVPVYE